MSLLTTLVLVSLMSFVFSAQTPTLLMNNGLKIPIVGLGAMGISEEAVREAIADGYRHIDTSLNYKASDGKQDSEVIIGKVLKELIKEGKVKREELFVVSKLESNFHERKKVPEGLKKSLSRLGLDYLDMYLVHSPSTNVALEETWLGMTDVLKANLTKSIGVSNFNEAQLDKISANGTKPVTNQVISNPYRNQNKLLSYLNKHNITLTAYSPLGGRHDPNLLKESKLIEVGKRHNVSAAQVALKYQVQRGVIVIPKANTPKYIKENIDLFGFTLTETDIKEIESLNKV